MAKEPETTRIKLKQGIVGNGFAHERGDEIDWPTAEAQRFIAAGYASLVPSVVPEQMTRTDVARAEKR